MKISGKIKKFFDEQNIQLIRTYVMGNNRNTFLFEKNGETFVYEQGDSGSTNYYVVNVFDKSKKNSSILIAGGTNQNDFIDECNRIFSQDRAEELTLDKIDIYGKKHEYDKCVIARNKINHPVSLLGRPDFRRGVIEYLVVPSDSSKTLSFNDVNEAVEAYNQIANGKDLSKEEIVQDDLER